MRTLKFRIWDYEEKRMIKSEQSVATKIARYITNDSIGMQVGDNKPSKIEIMQYTGVNDSNGVEIYAGDILGLTDPQDNSRGFVEWSDAKSMFVYKFFDGEDNYTVEMSLHSCLEGTQDMTVVIGNIYENHNLLNQENEVVS